MANDLNDCKFIGRLGADPETKYQGDGSAICNFRLAVGWKGKDKEGAEWVPCVAFGKLGEICGEYLKKGSQVFVSGRFKTEKYEKDGEDRYMTKIILSNMQMLGNRQESSAQPEPKPKREARIQAPPNGGFDIMDDDMIPF